MSNSYVSWAARAGVHSASCARAFALTAYLLTLLHTAAAHALTQPSGRVIPVMTGSVCDTLNTNGDGRGWGNVQICLDDYETTLGGKADTISAANDASVDQETFDPKCQLKFTVVQRGAGFLSVFGWYPAKGGDKPPALSDMHVLLGCSDKPGTVRTLTVPPGIDKVGFFMANDGYNCVPQNPDGTLASEPHNTFYSERRFNGKDRAGNPEGGLDQNQVRVLVWQSIAIPDSFYFGWEDNKYGADDDFEDLLTHVSGIECSSGGQECDTGKIGLCKKGTMQCRGGSLACVAVQEPTAEICNAVDDDCNGNVDDGTLCGAGEVCYRGNCVPNCSRGEFPCPGGSVCSKDQSVCVEEACADKKCPEGQICRGGECVGECVGVRCPYGEVCRNGGCVDACAGVQCDEGFVCAIKPDGPDGQAVAFCSSCGCKGCAANFTCVSDVCVENACATVSCPAGQHCEAGSCVDNCAGVVCPPAQFCAAGKCVVDPNAVADAGTSAGGTGSITLPPEISQPSTGGSSSTSNGRRRSAPRKGGDAGCACRLDRTTDASAALSLFVAALAIGSVLRRRKKS